MEAPVESSSGSGKFIPAFYSRKVPRQVSFQEVTGGQPLTLSRPIVRSSSLGPQPSRINVQDDIRKTIHSHSFHFQLKSAQFEKNNEEQDDFRQDGLQDQLANEDQYYPEGHSDFEQDSFLAPIEKLPRFAWYPGEQEALRTLIKKTPQVRRPEDAVSILTKSKSIQMKAHDHSMSLLGQKRSRECGKQQLEDSQLRQKLRAGDKGCNKFAKTLMSQVGRLIGVLDHGPVDHRLVDLLFSPNLALTSGHLIIIIGTLIDSQLKDKIILRIKAEPMDIIHIIITEEEDKILHIRKNVISLCIIFDNSDMIMPLGSQREDFRGQKMSEGEFLPLNYFLGLMQYRQEQEREQIPLGGCLAKYKERWNRFGLVFDLGEGLNIQWTSEKPRSRGYPVALIGSIIEAKEMAKLILEKLKDGTIDKSSDAEIQLYNIIFLIQKESGNTISWWIATQLTLAQSRTTLKMDNCRKLIQDLRRNDFSIIIDLKHAYSQVLMSKDSRRWFAPRTFTHLIHRVTARLRPRMIVIAYLDDFLFQFSTIENATKGDQKVMQLFIKLGLTILWEKSKLIPVQQFKFLGLDCDSTQMTVSPSLKRLALVWSRNHVKSKDQLLNQGEWNLAALLREMEILGLEWWNNRLKVPFQFVIAPFNVEAKITPDASKKGLGATLEINKEKFASQILEIDIQMLSSNNREMMAVLQSLEDFKQNLLN
ncbi:MAG: hypothetical protein EZS28_005309 [Streblomastix strix]|uniref:Reverse transcriptase domain-containing protein n=1 Tax=Streblomastix strix TaxID=222440 RepID=A0A5J4WVX5_9EUKA|nr:MAG: hypothetical protein EZS28_005309 [Streblomastix strix]